MISCFLFTPRPQSWSFLSVLTCVVGLRVEVVNWRGSDSSSAAAVVVPRPLSRRGRRRRAPRVSDVAPAEIGVNLRVAVADLPLEG